MDQKALIADRRDQLIKMTGEFADKYLDDEYLDLSRRLIEKMARKRQVPFLTGGLNVWAGAVIHALGTINFLFDASSEPHITVHDIAGHFGAATSTIGNRSKQIRDLFKMQYWDKEFSTARMLADRNRMGDMFALLSYVKTMPGPNG